METILIIEDSKVAQAQLQDILEGAYRLEIREDGSAGMECAHSEAPDLILLDVNLPDMNGYEVCRCLKSDPAMAEVPVLFLTSLDHPQEKVRGFEAGADDYIVKPFYPGELLARIHLHLTSRRQKEAAVELERMRLLREMAVTMNHELNNPMTTAFGLLYLASKELSSEQEPARAHLKQIRTELIKIRDIVERLSAASRAATTDYILGEKMIDLERI